MVQPIQYVTPGAFDPFNSLMQGVRLGASMEEMQAARQQREMQQQQMLMQQDMVRAQQQALQQKAMQEQARQEELARLQAIPYEQMTKEQALRMMDLTQSEATRAHIARRLEAIPAEKRQTLARDYGSTLIALTMNPEIGVRRLRERAQVETDPAEKKALEDAVRIAELDPLLAARTIHGSMHMSQDPGMVKIAESATKYLETAGKPLYPKQVEPQVVGGSVFFRGEQPGTGTFLTPPRQSQLLSPEEEAQKARLAAAGRSPGVQVNMPSQPRPPSKFEEEMDKKFAPLAVEWEAGERALATSRIRQLDAVTNVLKTGKRITNPVLGITPDVVLSFVNPGARQARANAERVIQEGMRAVLGAQYTQKEGERLLERSYDISAPQSDNLARLTSIVEQMKSAAADRQAMLEYMRGPGNGSLMGYKGRIPSINDFYEAIDKKPPASGQGGAPAASPRVEGVPRGVDPAVWNVMTPEERALWRK